MVKLFRGGLVNSDFNAGDLWTHAVAVGAGARILARKTRIVPADEAFLAGLIHDTGILVEMQAYSSNFGQVIQRIETDDTVTFRMAEQEVLGASHEVFGVGLCKAWNFPESLQFVTGYHHRPWELAEAVRPLPALIHVADVLAARLGLGYARTVETQRVEPEVLDFARLTSTDLDELAEALPAAVKEADLPLE
jgi:HD-like signal output (HDOD) protein